VHDYASDTRNSGNQFAAGGPDFQIYGANLGRDWGVLGAGLSTQLNSFTRIGAQYQGYVTPTSEANGGMAQLQSSW
jgi:uncharacterized protein with beta-barrel porin domain